MLVPKAGEGINFSTSGEGLDTAEQWLNQTTEDRLDPSDIVRKQAFGHVEGPKRLRELVACTGQVIAVAVILDQLKCLRLRVYFVSIEPALSIYFTAIHFITSQ